MVVNRFGVAAVQMAAGADWGANIEVATELVGRAAERGARLVVLPEVFSWRGSKAEEGAHRESIPGPTTSAMAALARARRIFVCMGSVLEEIPGDRRAFNTSCLIDPTGTIVGRYRKMHLFDIDLPGRVTVRESDGRAAGAEAVTVATELGTLGMSICYDLRFPELYRRLAAAGAEVLLIPSAFTFPTGAAHWEVLCRARAIENQCWVIAANQAGTSPHGFADYGHSLIVDPWGTVVAQASSDGPEVVFAEVDRERTAQVRRELPCLQHRRLE